MATTMSGDSFLSRLLGPQYVVTMARSQRNRPGGPGRGAQKRYDNAMAEIDRLVLARASTLTGLDLVGMVELMGDPSVDTTEEQS